jgi:hypothetical protein
MMTAVVFIDLSQFIEVSKMPVPFRHASVLKANVATSSPPRRDSGRATFIYSRVVISYRDIGTSPRRYAAVEGGFDGAPIRHVLGEDGLKSRAVRRFEEVGQFVEHYVIDGGRRLFGQFEVEDDIAALRSARPPLAFHGADADGWGRDAEPGTPIPIGTPTERPASGSDSGSGCVAWCRRRSRAVPATVL